MNTIINVDKNLGEITLSDKQSELFEGTYKDKKN
jgi:hypothetical protein